MDKHKGVYKQQIPMFSKAVLVSQLEKLSKLKRQRQAIELQMSRVNLVIINSGEHWLLADVNYQNRRVVLMDPYGPEKVRMSVSETQKVLKTAKLEVKLRKMGSQLPGDSNSCGYHVLQWVWQIQGLRNFDASAWVPTGYDNRQWTERVCRDLGEQPQRGARGER